MMLSAKVDREGRTVHVNRETGMLKIDGLCLARVVRRPDGIYIQVRDTNRERAAVRGTEFVEVKWEAFVQQISQMR